jgi:hypothetical protein
MKTAESIADIVKETLSKVYPQIAQGEWVPKDYKNAVLRRLRADAKAGRIDFNQHIDEIVEEYVEVSVEHDLKRREKLPLFATGAQFTLSDFKEESAREQVIPLGDGHRVTVYDATYRHWVAKQSAQAKQISAVSATMQSTTELLESEAGELLSKHPNMTTGEAMKRLGYWK